MSLESVATRCFISPSIETGRRVGLERRFYSLASGLCSFVTNFSLSDLCSLSTRDVIDLKEHLMTSHWKDRVVISMYKDTQLDVYEHSATRKVVYIDSGWL